MRWLLALAALAAALVFMAASAAMNWVFLSSLGKSHLEAQIFGAVSIAIDVFKSLLPVFIGWALVNGKRIFAVVACGVFALLFCFSLMSAIGFAAGNRGAVTGGREVIALRYQAAVRDVAEVEARLKAVPPARPETVIVEALRASEQDKRWSSSKSCTEATAVESRTFCETYFKTKGELAAALEIGRLDGRLQTLKQEVLRLQGIGATEESDVQAGLLSRLTGVGVSTAQMLLVMFVAVLVEIGAALGLYLAIGWLPEKRPRDVAREVVSEVATDQRTTVTEWPRAAVPMPVRMPAAEVVEAVDPPLRRLRIAKQS